MKTKKLISITDYQIDFIKRVSLDMQISFTEALKRILDDYIGKNIKPKGEKRD